MTEKPLKKMNSEELKSRMESIAAANPYNYERLQSYRNTRSALARVEAATTGKGV